MVVKIAHLLHHFHRLDIPGPREAELWPILFKWADLGTAQPSSLSSFLVGHASSRFSSGGSD